MSKRSGKSLGDMEGLKSYEPDKGWSDIDPTPEIEKSSSEQNIDEHKFDNWEASDDVEHKTSLKTKTNQDNFFEEDFIEDIQESKMSNLARQVAETNTLVDKALGTLSESSNESGNSKTLDELGESLHDLFGQLYEGSGASSSSPWSKISDSLGDLSTQIDKRDSLKEQLKETQHSIDKARLKLIEEIQELANSEQERLSVIRMRSRLASVMADKLLNKLR
ncbi:MAG: hypothetical protein CBD16_05730 [Betaproteobacteria bacterium TMED156]|nr:MAG: hypothetical protein CBD16_05730 [Betaproteobacteria bacterium TMED156]|tara:strand:- start:75 stop:737 length:663 start_codon:yes stop_codon:yes gene_type:complete